MLESGFDIGFLHVLQVLCCSNKLVYQRSVLISEIRTSTTPVKAANFIEVIPTLTAFLERESLMQ